MWPRAISFALNQFSKRSESLINPLVDGKVLISCVANCLRHDNEDVTNSKLKTKRKSRSATCKFMYMRNHRHGYSNGVHRPTAIEPNVNKEWIRFRWIFLRKAKRFFRIRSNINANYVPRKITQKRWRTRQKRNINEVIEWWQILMCYTYRNGIQTK